MPQAKNLFIIAENSNWVRAEGRSISLINEIRESDKIQLLYRGAKLSQLKKNYSILGDDECDLFEIGRSLANKIFGIGYKSQYYVGGKKTRFEHDIVDAAESVSEIFLKKLYLKLKEISLNRRNRNKDLNNFILRNNNFLDSVEKLTVSDFIARVTKLNQIEKNFVRDYYLALLHQVGFPRFLCESVFVSTSKSEKQARKFAMHNNSHKMPIVMIDYFLPKPFDCYAIGPYSLKQKVYIDILERENLPIVSLEPFSHEEEFSVRRALFPHFILSFSIISFEQDEISILEYLNPSLGDPSTVPKLVTQQGFDINQSNFLDIIRQTEFYRSGYFDGQVFTEKNVKKK